MLVTLAGIVTLVSFVFLKALVPMLVMPLPMVTLARLVQSAKVEASMLVTLSGKFVPICSLVPCDTHYCSNSIPDKELCQQIFFLFMHYYSLSCPVIIKN